MADLGSPMGVNFETISMHFRVFGRFRGSSGRAKPPCSPVGAIFVDFLKIIDIFLLDLVYIFDTFWKVLVG